MKTKEEIISQGYDALVDALGVTDAVRFLQHFRTGKGDYTKERYQWLEKQSLTEVWEKMERLSDLDQKEYEEIIK
mgnify:CR=1 FL=1